ncbi:MAG: FAD-dependent oxidoreductase, partial [Myxococcales bacterium]|nr:FAD-dependent oxidoreductase [Myxococcales bacterium]
ACLDHVFERKRATCLVNPFAAYEAEWRVEHAATPRRVAVVGAGPAGLACATTAARRGHQVTLFEASDRIGGQFNLAKRIPGKAEFEHTLRYFEHRLAETGVTVRLGTRATAQALKDGGFDHVVLATGVSPRHVNLPGGDHPKVLSYLDVLRDDAPVGDRVAIIGAGGIGFDVAEFLAHKQPDESAQGYYAEWGIDTSLAAPGGLTEPKPHPVDRQITLCQRRPGKLGANLGKTTGWIHRSSLKAKGVEMLAQCTYLKVDDAGLHLEVAGQPRVLPVDHVIVCAGQVPFHPLEAELQAAGIPVQRIGGADVAAELDAKRAIRQGTEVACAL